MSGLEGRILTLIKELEEEKHLADKRAKQLYLATGGVATFLGLTDTPAAYTGQAGKFVKVNATPNALIFANLVAGDLPSHSHAWADVSKTGSNLTDLATRQHAGLTNVTQDQHHPKSHTLASHSSKLHTELTGVTVNQHHARDHEATHRSGGADALNHDNLAGFIAAEHVSLPNSMANVINAGHTKTLHDGLGLDHGALSGKGDDDHSQYYNAARHTKAVHDALGIIAAEAYGLDVEDTRAAQRLPNEMPGNQVTAEFTDRLPGLGAWYSLINVKGWSTGYASWQLIGGSTTTTHENLYFRSGVGAAWNPLRKIWHEGCQGSGSGLDADKLDGYHHASFMKIGGGAFTGLVTARNHGTGTVDEVVNICYGTSDTPPAVGSVTEGTIYIKYTP